MTSRFELELDKLKNIIAKLGNLTERQVNEAVHALLAEPVLEKKGVNKVENKIDKLDIKTEQVCLNIFALEQPVASDLRYIMSALRISNELERIGDLAVSIIKKTKKINCKHDLLNKLSIADLALKVQLVYSKTIEVLETRDAKSIEEIFILNEEIDEVVDNTIDALAEEMKQNIKVIDSATYLILILRYLDRTSDHCTNICESVIFAKYGDIIKHEKFDGSKYVN